MSATIRIDNRMGMFTRLSTQAMQTAIQRMAQDIGVLSDFKVPEKDGTLRRSRQIKVLEILHVRIQYGETAAQDYAGYQHRGMRKDGTHIVRHYTKAGSQKNFLGSAGDTIATKATSYFKQEASKVRV